MKLSSLMVLCVQLEHPSCDVEYPRQVGLSDVAKFEGIPRPLDVKDTYMRLVEHLLYSQSSSIEDTIGRARWPQNN